MPCILSTFFGRKLALNAIDTGAESVADLYFSRSFDESELHVALLKFFEKITGSSQLCAHIAYIRNMDERTRRLLKDTILTSELYIASFHVASAAGSLLITGGCRSVDLENAYFGSRLLVSYLNS